MVARPRLLFLTRKWPPAVGGMETYSVELAARLAEVTELTTLALPGNEDGTAPGGGAIVGYGASTSRIIVKTAQRYDIVYAGDMAVWPLVWLARKVNPDIRTALSAHGTDVAFATRTGARAGLYRTYMKTGAARLVGTPVIANSTATEALCRKLGFANTSVVPLAALFAESATPAAPKPYLLFVGRLIERKGCRWFIENVLPRLPESMTLKVAGTIGDAAEGLALDHPRVEFLGPVYGEALAKLRREALAVVVPNIDLGPTSFEGFGLTATEAAGDGGVVIAADIFGLKEAIIPGETGYLEPAGDAAAWAGRIAAIASWSQHRRAGFVQAATHLTRETYNWDRVAEETLAVVRAAA